MKRTALPFIFLSFSALCSMAPLLMTPDFMSGGWDLSTHISKAYQVAGGMKEGILYPRWLPLSNGGYGSPTTIFYSPLFYMIAGVLNLVVPSFTVSLKVAIFAGFLLSGTSMYIFLRNFCGPFGSVMGGIIYQLLPYHIFEFYMRESLAETFSFFWFPLVLHFLYKGFNDGRLNHWTGLAFSYAGLILTYMVSAYIFTFVMAAYALFLFLVKKNAGSLLKFVAAGLFGLSISSVYFLPMFFERKFVHIDWLKDGPWDYKRSFLYLAENISDPFYVQLERIVILCSLLIIASLTLVYYRMKRHGGMPNIELFSFFLWIFLFSMFISTSLSTPFWELIPGMSTTLFPWRWLMISTLACSILSGVTLDAFSLTDIKKYRSVRIAGAVFFTFFIINLYLSSLYMMTADTTRKTDLLDSVKNGDVVEFRPVWLADKRKNFSRDKWTPAVLIKGDGSIHIYRWESHSRRFMVKVLNPSVVRVTTFYYPGWTALINGREVPVEIEKESGAMLINVPPGTNEVLLEFRDTPLRTSAGWISIISVFAALFGIVNQKKLKRIAQD